MKYFFDAGGSLWLEHPERDSNELIDGTPEIRALASRQRTKMLRHLNGALRQGEQNLRVRIAGVLGVDLAK